MSNCECDEPELRELNIPAGLDALPRQVRSFSSVREALLRSLPGKLALQQWQARGERDLGVMLLEMWAYVSDVLNFYDERIANETYLRTAQRRPSLRRLIELLGYLENPGVAGSVALAAIADGKLPVVLPAGTAFRSDAFGNEAPQVFEIGEETTIHPLKNEWQVGPIKRDRLPHTTPSVAENPSLAPSNGRTRFLVFEARDFGLSKGSLVVLRFGSTRLNTFVKALKPFNGVDERSYVEVELGVAVYIPAGTKPSEIEVLRPRASAVVTANELVGTSPPNDQSPVRVIPGQQASDVFLDAVYPQLRTQSLVLVSLDGNRSLQSSTVTAVSQTLVRMPGQGGGGVTQVGFDTDYNPATFEQLAVVITPSEPPPPTIRVTRLKLSPIVARGVAPGRITFHFDFISAGTVTTVGSPEVRLGDIAFGNRAVLSNNVRLPPGTVDEGEYRELNQTLLFQDEDEQGLLADASLRFSDAGRASVSIVKSEEPIPTFRTNLHVFGNVLTATRGESVFNEVLGSGDPQQSNQKFQLRKKPLTYVDDVTDPRGYRTTLKVRVDGVLWKEVRSFFGCGPKDPVYIVRHDDDRNTLVTFGDGVRGARLPRGVDNIVANYRFGAGEAAPPASSVQQIARQVEGLSTVISPVAAFPGRDPDPPEVLRTTAPRSVLLLKRAVSVADIQALASQFNGVCRACARFVYLAEEQRAGVSVTYIGNALQNRLAERLISQSDPNIAILVNRAFKLDKILELSVAVHPDFDPQKVALAVKDALLDDKEGLLSPRNADIGGQFWMSHLYRAALDVEGVVSVQSAGIRRIGQEAQSLSATDVLCIPEGAYFGFSREGVVVTPVEPVGSLAPAQREGH